MEVIEEHNRPGQEDWTSQWDQGLEEDGHQAIDLRRNQQ
jgi:hypothetical protein